MSVVIMAHYNNINNISLCTSSMVHEAEERVDMQLKRINNQMNFQEQNITWQLCRTWIPRKSYILISKNRKRETLPMINMVV